MIRLVIILFLFWVNLTWASYNWASHWASHDWASHDSPERDFGQYVLQGGGDTLIGSGVEIVASIVSAWDVDELGNTILVEVNQLKKYDAKGNLLFSQSIKNVGKITKLDARNPMKILFFSEDQQLVGVLDNSLTFQGENFDLSTFGLSYVQAFSSSFQNNKFWVYDQDNSKLELLSTNNQQSVKVENLKSLLGFNEVTQLIEESNFLYLFDKTKGVYKLDNYGNLIDFTPIQTGSYISVEKNVIYVLTGNKLLAFSQKESTPLVLSLPNQDIVQFKKQGAYFYFLEKNKLSKFSFKK